MQQSTNNVDELLEQWEKLKNVSAPRNDSMVEVITHACVLNQIESYAHSLRNSRLTNNKQDELAYTAKFVELYYDFSKDYVFKVLKNG